MRLTNQLRVMLVSALVVGQLAALVLVVCPESLHFAFSPNMGSACAAMQHSGATAATVAEESVGAHFAQAAAVGSAIAPEVLAADAPERVMFTGRPPGLSPDPLHGRLRI